MRPGPPKKAPLAPVPRASLRPAPSPPPKKPPSKEPSPPRSPLEDSRQRIPWGAQKEPENLDDEDTDEGDETPLTTPRSEEGMLEGQLERMEEQVRDLERTLRKEHLRERLEMEEQYEAALTESAAKIRMLESMLRTSNNNNNNSKKKSSQDASDEDDDEDDEDLITVDNCVGFSLPESLVLGATLSSQGPVVTGMVKVETLGSVCEMDRVFRSPTEVRLFFREHFPWGTLDQPLRVGKRVYCEIMEAFEHLGVSCVHLHFRLAAMVRASLESDVVLADGYMELLDALRKAGRPSDFDLFVLDCGGPRVCSSVVAGGAIFLVTFPSSPTSKPWHVARLGARRFREIVCERDEPEEEETASEKRMARAPLHVLESALTVLLKMHVNLSAYPGQQKYQTVPLRSKVFARVASVEGAAEFLVEHGWVESPDGNKIVFKGNGKVLEEAIAALERMAEVVARRKERAYPGLVCIDGGSQHGSTMTWDEFRATHALYRAWLTSVTHRSRMSIIKADYKNLERFVPVDHPLRPRLRLTVAKATVAVPPPVTDLIYVCADDMAEDLVLRIPHGFVPVLRQSRIDRSPTGDLEDLASLPMPPREKGHREHMILCYRSGPPAGARPPITGVQMEIGAESQKGKEFVRCVCGLSVPTFTGGAQMVASRVRSEVPLRSVAAVKLLLSAMPKGYETLKLNGEDFNFLGSDGVESLLIGLKF